MAEKCCLNEARYDLRYKADFSFHFQKMNKVAQDKTGNDRPFCLIARQRGIFRAPLVFGVCCPSSS